MKDDPAKCLGKWHPSLEGDWFDCEHEFAGEVTCDDCIFGANGGRYDPRRPLEEQMSDMEVPDPLDNGPDDDRQGPELDDLEFEEGDFGEGYPWYITENHELEVPFYKPCRHCRQPTPEEKEARRINVSRQTPSDGKEPFVICPWTVNSVNEGGCNSTSVCLQCIIEAGYAIQLKDKLKELLGRPCCDVIPKVRDIAVEMSGGQQVACDFHKPGQPTRQELITALGNLVDWAEQAAAQLDLRPQCLDHAIELLRMEDAT